MTDLEFVLNHIRPDRLNDLLIEAVNHYSPSFAEGPAIRVFIEALNRAGIPYREQHVPASPGDTRRVNLLIELGPCPPQLLLLGHLDTIPAWGDEDDHGARREGDIVYGLGTADMKSGCAAMVEAITALLTAGVSFHRGVCLGLVVGEEEYGDGSEALLQTIQAPLTVIGEPTNLMPCTEHFGYLEGRLTSKGRRAHAALPDIGENAIHAMLTWLIQILEQARKLPFAQHIAFNPREISGGGNLFIIAEQCETTLDMHVPAGVDPKTIMQLIEEARQIALQSHKACELHYEELYWAPGYHLAPDDARLAPLKRAYAHLKRPWEPTAFRSHSDGNMFFQAGTLPVICGPGQLEVAHTRNEHVYLSQVEEAARLYAALIYETCCIR